MNFFICSSSNLNNGQNRNLGFAQVDFSENDVLKDAKMGGFFLSLLFSYTKFLLLKLTHFFSLPEFSILHRQYFCINKYFRHVLVVEWGFYNEGATQVDLAAFHADSSLKYFRPYDIIQYDCSRFDLEYPLYKSDYNHFAFSTFAKYTSYKLEPRFFFNFFVILPVNICGYVRLVKFGDDAREPQPPMKIKFPVLFELFLLKFNFCALLFSSALSSIYEFYSLGYLKNFVFTLLNICFLLKNKYFYRCNTFSDVDLMLLIKKASFSNNVLFYSLKRYSIKYFLSSYFYQSQLNQHYIDVIDVWVSKFNFFFKNLVFIILCLYSFSIVDFDQDDLFYYAGLTYNLRLNFLFAIIAILLFTFIFRRLRGLLSSFDALFSYVVQSFWSSFSYSFFGFLSYLVLLKMLYAMGLHTIFFSVILSTFIFFLFSLFVNINNIIWLYLDNTLLKKKYLPKLPFSDVDSSFLITFLPIFTLPFLFFFKVFLDSFLIVCDFASRYTPSVHNINYSSELDFNTFAVSGFKVPFYDISFNRYVQSYDKNKFEFKDEYKNFPIYIAKQTTLQLNYNDSYFFKFLSTQSDQLFEIQYNYFNAKNKSFFDCTYQNYTIYMFPSKFFFLFAVMDVWVFIFVINVVWLVLQNLLSLNFNPIYAQLGVSSWYSKIKIYQDSTFNSTNLSWTTYRIFDIFFLTESVRYAAIKTASGYGETGKHTIFRK